MTLALGTRLGPYEILTALGAGGMGEVYRAKDTRLDRSVAVKVLPSHLTGDPDLRARFEREAKAVSSLNHPHICTLHDVGQHEGTDYLVMELVEGETLADRLKKGALPLEQTLRIAIEIADALDKAHRQGVIHRDLKPGNVMLTKSGSKLMDFGLAKLTIAGDGAGIVSALPTASAPLTGQGAVLGTVPYMAPEQLEGKEADARSDLWAFGCLLYEMATGCRAFEGKSQASLISAIMDKEPPPISQLQPLTPPSLERLVKVCLAKDPDDRFQIAHDVMQELKWIAEAPSGAAATAAGAAGGLLRSGTRGQKRWELVLGAIALLAAGILGAVIERSVEPRATTTAVIRTSLDVRPAQEVNAGFASAVEFPTPGGSHTAIAWTPDGRTLLFVGRNRAGVAQIYVRELDQEEARPLAGTDGAKVFALSRDGQWIAFWADRAIRRVPLAGGPATALAVVPEPPEGMACGAKGEVFYASGFGSEPIWRVSADRTRTAVTTATEGESFHILPALLPGDRVLLYTVQRRQWTWGDEQIVAQMLATGERKTLLNDAVDARYLPSGHLVFLRRGTLFAVGFDAERLALRGSPVAVMDRVAQALSGYISTDVTGAGQFAVSSNGTLAYVPGAVVPYRDRAIVEVDRRGRPAPLAAAARSYFPMLDASADGRRLAISIFGSTEVSVQIHDIARDSFQKLTSEGEAAFPRWTRDGKRVAFNWLRNGRAAIAWQRADGTAPPEVLVEADGIPSSWSPDGRTLAFVKDDDLWTATVEGSKALVEQITNTPQWEHSPEFSPDGRWLAFASNESGRFEAYVRPWPGPGPTRQASIEGSASLAWNPAGRELFFASPLDSAGKRRMMVVDMGTGPDLVVGTPRLMFEFSANELGLTGTPVRAWAVAPDGQRFFAFQTAPAVARPPITHIELVQNWSEEMKARVAAGQGKQP